MFENYDVISSNLSKAQYAVRRDQALFNQYHDGKITIEECLDEFFKNNKIKDKRVQDKITPQMFKKWLLMLGYCPYEK